MVARNKEMFQLGAHNKGGCRPQVRQDRREKGSEPPGLAGPTLPLELRVCRQMLGEARAAGAVNYLGSLESS